MEISNGNIRRARHLKNHREFRELWPDDEEFKSAFAYHSIPSRVNSKKIRFLLSEIEKNLGTPISYLNTSLEHICPYHPNEVWHANFGQGINEVRDRVGNMVLLENDDLGVADFESKKEHYRTTPFQLTQKIATYDEWNLETLNHYQTWLADRAVETWQAQ